jgi:hypothetical protein
MNNIRRPKWLRAVWLLVLVTVFSLAASNSSFSQDGTRRARALYFVNTSFGALAWIPKATTTDKKSAAGQIFVNDLSDSTCFGLPVRESEVRS